ncbi:MAG: Cellulase [archaeon GW2011_AR20]|nr:MAG: Cellulase [archaeon GW2011_AR20]MBS3160897.1 M28 family peptidase [Candidatus Woesearchaeota archaeon]
MVDLLEELLNAFGVSGSEANIRKIIIREIKKYVHDIHVDKSGNLIAHKKGKRPKVMLAAHMDEVGLIVKNIDPHGRVFFSVIGGIDPLALICQRVSVETTKGLVFGVITIDDMSNAFNIEVKPKLSDLYVDTGLTQKELIKIGVQTGDYIYFKRKTIKLGTNDLLSGKALDDRVGCYILLQLAKKLKQIKNEVYLTFTVQEEIGLYGAKTSAYTIDPDWAIAVDVTNADDYAPDATIRMSKGPSITIKDAEMLGNHEINQWIMKLCKKHRIPLQLDVSDFGTTDALNIAVSKKGVPATAMTVPVRNLHTTIGIVDRNDINYAVKLLYLLLKNPPKLKL